MKHFEFPRQFRILFEKAAGFYAQGQRGPDTFFTPDEKAFLAGNGITPQHLFDYGEDQTHSGEPGFENALGIELVRRDYFLNVQGGKPSQVVLNDSTLPPKTHAVKGIEWLPRIIPKARAKLRGELPATLMYCCGGDRRFFMERNILPAEFLSLVWRSGDDDAAIVEWVVRRKTGG